MPDQYVISTRNEEKSYTPCIRTIHSVISLFEDFSLSLEMTMVYLVVNALIKEYSLKTQ
jgi:hypothetical protein